MDLQESFSEDPKLLESWLATIGMLTIFWSPIERRIDQCVHLLYSNLPKSSNKNKPGSLQRKLEFITCHLPDNVANKDQILSLVKNTKNTVQIRDVCVHGVLESYDQHEMKISKIDGKKSEHATEIFTIDSKRLNISAQSLSNLSKDWELIVNMLVQEKTNS